MRRRHGAISTRMTRPRARGDPGTEQEERTMKTTYVAASMALMLMALTSAPTTAQRRADAVTRVRVESAAGRRSDYGYDRYEYDRYEVDRYDRVGRRGSGPAFCRNGRGHPTKGWRWCVEKGWAGYGHARANRARWDRVRWGRVDLFAPRGVGRLGWLPAERFLDRKVVKRLRKHRSRLGLRGGMSARWIRDRGGETVVQVRAGGFLMAEMRDYDRDGFADLIMVARF